ncbi:hypothetical protein ASF61_05690 [Duganella sp. Leaf126]|uniref:hypothetical protein n=1 Tax=Duganella sp. Leaf126 TaxID=1736266 RepID=UPI0006F8A8B9|nr:hypothetical protein [Duganella sp. Leaf126]KQQ40268.1 hypothetical protein ASF61_05690 [Duganella sp. Leaf126]
MSAPPSGLLDYYLPRYTFAHRYRTVVHCGDIGRVYDIARNVDLSQSRAIVLLFRLRGLPRGCWRARAFCSAMHWTELAQRRPAEFLVAYWRGGDGNRIRRIDHAAQFRDALPGASQKVGFAFRFRQLDAGRVEVATETRVLCIGARSRLAFFGYWWLIKPFSGLVRKEILRLIRREAES